MAQPEIASKPVTKESRIRAEKEKYNKHDKFDREEKGQGRSGQKNNAQKNEKKAGRFIKPVKPVEKPVEKKEDEIRTVTLPDRMTIRELADILKCSQFKEISETGHEVNLESPEKLASLLREFYRSI